MKKQTIRLNESQLRQVIKESIMNILNEGLNELDPRTYANYARGREAQANGQRPMSQSQINKGMNQQQIKNQANNGRNSAVDAWNKQYGYDGSSLSGRAYRNMYQLDSDNYHVTDGFYKDENNYGEQDVNARTGEGKYKNDISSGTRNYRMDDTLSNHVAKQMANGTGTYNKQTGRWQ